MSCFARAAWKYFFLLIYTGCHGVISDNRSGAGTEHGPRTPGLDQVGYSTVQNKFSLNQDLKPDPFTSPSVPSGTCDKVRRVPQACSLVVLSLDPPFSLDHPTFIQPECRVSSGRSFSIIRSAEYCLRMRFCWSTRKATFWRVEFPVPSAGETAKLAA